MNKWHQAYFRLHSLGRHCRILYLDLIIIWLSMWMHCFQIHFTRHLSNDPFNLLFRLTGREQTLLFSFHLVLHYVSCYFSEAMTSWLSKPGMISPLCMAQHPTLTAALALQLICPGWAASRLAEEQPWWVAHDHVTAFLRSTHILLLINSV